MGTFRQSRIVAAIIAILSIVFMQIAVAGYVCPEFKISMPDHTAPAQIGAVEIISEACHEMDIEQPGLCGAHAQAGNQSLDKYELPPVQPFVAGFLANVVLPIEPRDFPVVASTGIELLERTTAPPASIRNCCFHI